jgi:hypothetical protein
LETETGPALELKASFETTNALTVEFWFRFPKIEVDGDREVQANEVIYLYSMTGDGISESMSVYIDPSD